MASGGKNDFIREGEVLLWRVSDGALIRTLTGHDVVTSLAFSPDGQTLASGGRTGWPDSEGEIKLWQVSDGALLQTLTGLALRVNSVAFSPDGQTLASGSSTGESGFEGEIKLWRVLDGALIETYKQGTHAGVYSMQYSPDGQLLAYGRMGPTLVVAQPLPSGRLRR